MNKDILNIIRTNKYIFNYLREESYNYKELYRDSNYINIINNKAKEKYKIRVVDKINKLKDNINIINNLIDVLK